MKRNRPRLCSSDPCITVSKKEESCKRCKITSKDNGKNRVTSCKTSSGCQTSDGLVSKSYQSISKTEECGFSFSPLLPAVKLHKDETKEWKIEKQTRRGDFFSQVVLMPYNTQLQDVADTTSIHGFKHRLEKFTEEKTRWGH